MPGFFLHQRSARPMVGFYTPKTALESRRNVVVARIAAGRVRCLAPRVTRVERRARPPSTSRVEVEVSRVAPRAVSRAADVAAAGHLTAGRGRGRHHFLKSRRT